jgi:hypothetical protein
MDSIDTMNGLKVPIIEIKAKMKMKKKSSRAEVAKRIDE